MNSPTPGLPHNLEHSAVHPNGDSNGNGNGDYGELVETRHGVHQVSPAVADRLKGLNAAPEETAPGTPSPSARKRLGWIVGGVVALVTLAALGYWVFSSLQLFGTDYVATNAAGEDVRIEGKSLQFLPVGRDNIIFTIIDKGELEAVDNEEIICKVRSSSRGSSDATTIEKMHVEDGQRVKKGDLLLTLNATSFIEQRGPQEIEKESAELAKKQAEDDVNIVMAQNAIDIKEATTAHEIAVLNLQKYKEGDLEQKRKDVLGRKALAESDYVRFQEKYAISQRALQRGILSPSQAQQDEAALKKAQIDLDKVEEELRVLEVYESKVNIKDWETKVEVARKKLETVVIQTKSKLNQANSKLTAQDAILQKESTKLKDLEDDIKNCTIKAPRAGMVVFFVDDRSSWSSSARLIAADERVGSGQRLMRIPDLTKMQVKMKVHESLEPKLRHALRTGPLPATIKVASREQPLNLQGNLRSVAAAASSIDRYSSDVRVYVATVAVDRTFDPDGFYIKPGTSAEVTVFVDERKNVLKLPVQAVIAVGNQHFCYVRNGNRLEKRPLQVGLNNTKFIEIKEGLKEGEDVLQNPRGVAEKLNHLQAAAGAESAPEQQEPPTGPRPPADPVNGTTGDGTKPARPPGGFDPNAIFDRLDKNTDGKIERSEASGKTLDNFDQNDTNKDGAIDKVEFRKAFERMRPPGGAPGGGRPPEAG